MNILSWNVCGLTQESQRYLYEHCRLFTPTIIGIIEPKSAFRKIRASYWKSIDMVPVHQNDRGKLCSNIWVLAKPSTRCTVVFSSPQAVIVDFAWQQDLFRAIFVHGAGTYTARRTLWSEILANLTPKVVCLGDFNAIKGAHEKTGCPPTPISCREFCQFIDDAEFVEPSSSGLRYTWSCRRLFPQHIESILDRVLVSQSFEQRWFTCSYNVLPRLTSDHSPIVLSCTIADPIPKAKPFKFFSMWTQHPGFHELIREVWDEDTGTVCPIYTVMAKLKSVKARLKTWNKQVFGMVDVNIAAIQSRLLDVQQKIADEGYTDETFEEEVGIQADLNMALNKKNEMFRQQSRISWLHDGDRNTSFFHNMIKQRRNSHTISQLHINGVPSFDQAAIANHIVQFYTDLFTGQTAVADLNRVDDLVPRSVSSSHAALLTNIPDDNEIKAAVFSMDAYSAPGPDGFSGCFYHSCWDIIKKDITRAVRCFFTRSYIPKGLNSSIVILIPKKEVVTSVRDFRPIVLSNFLFKIISKVLATRLGVVAAEIVAPNQFGFIKGKQIHDCIMLASEGVNCMERTSSGRNMACKIDISKAFDTMSWEFIFRVLRAFGFPDAFVHWISCIFESAKLSILVNGATHGYFSCSRGVRQGDPLSPILFGIAEDVLSRMLHNAVIWQRLKPMVFSRRANFPSHLLYADDIMLFCIASPENAQTIQRTLRDYGSLSGQICNAEKSNIYFGDGVSTALKRSINRVLNFHLGSTPFNYLGVPLFAGRPSKDFFIPIRDRILSKFPKWYGTQLSMAGRICLVKSVIQSSTTHAMLVYRWPKQIITDVDNACRNFIWTGSITDRPYRSVAWDWICAPKENGGLGIRSLRIMNDSLLAKIAWKILRGTDFGYSMIKAKYLDRCLQPIPVRVMSSVWMGVRRGIGQLIQDSFCSIGDGTTVLFWWDDWLGYSIAEKLGIPPYLKPFLNQTVADYLFDGAWHFTTPFVNNHPNIVVDILTTPLGDRDDIRLWKPSLSGEVTSRDVYQQLSTHGLKVKWGSWIWASYLPARRSLVSWRAIRGRLPTQDYFARHGFLGPNMCMLCRRNEESIDHIFWLCPIAVEAWKRFLEWFDLKDFPIFYDINSFIVFAMNVDFSPQFKNIWKLGIITLIWKLWIERNNCVFEGKQANFMQIVAFVKAAILEAAMTFKLGHCSPTGTDFQRGRRLGIACAPAPPPNITSVTWWPPLPQWIKVNTDGAALGSPGVIAAGGVFRDATSSVRGCFHFDGGIGFACEAELLAAITAVSIAHARGWRRLWLETDSTYIEGLFNAKSTAVPWRYVGRWRRTLRLIDEMDFRVSHIYREGNQVADIMANPNTPVGWWPYPIPLISAAVARDSFSPRFHRFS